MYIASSVVNKSQTVMNGRLGASRVWLSVKATMVKTCIGLAYSQKPSLLSLSLLENNSHLQPAKQTNRTTINLNSTTTKSPTLTSHAYAHSHLQLARPASAHRMNQPTNQPTLHPFIPSPSSPPPHLRIITSRSDLVFPSPSHLP
jgi:hypothetical protein